MKEYRNKVYRVRYPEHWECMEKVYCGDHIIYFYYNNMKDGFPNINLSLYYNHEGSILEIVKATRQDIRNYLRRIEIIDCDISDDQKGVLIYEGDRDGVRYHFYQLIIKRKAETLSCTATCKKEVLDIYKVEMEEAIMSLRFNVDDD